jgi:hypothetical protein
MEELATQMPLSLLNACGMVNPIGRGHHAAQVDQPEASSIPAREVPARGTACAVRLAQALVDAALSTGTVDIARAGLVDQQRRVGESGADDTGRRACRPARLTRGPAAVDSYWRRSVGRVGTAHIHAFGICTTPQYKMQRNLY